MKKTLKILFLAAALAICCNACILVPVIDSIKKAGFSEGDRKRLLGESVKKFHDTLHWGDPNKVIPLIDAENLETVSNYLQENAEEEKIVESKVKDISFKDNAFTAVVDVSTSAYKIPVYIVTKRVERETWNFSISDGWKISAIELLKDSSKK